MMREDTIVALATAPGQAAICLLRLSGPEVGSIMQRVWDRTFKSPRVATLGTIRDAEGAPIDQVLATWFQGPHSYTGEDTIEVSGHGGVLIAKRLLERFLNAGARLADPGEFTQRAFLNGKLDLSQAEAVMDLISASTDLALQSAHQQLSGRLGQHTQALRAELLQTLAHVEAWIDFPDDDIDPDTGAALAARMQEVDTQIVKLLATADQGRLLREGARTVITGAPNAGKSSLLNCLLGFDRALVSDTPGTTRDTVEEVINLGGLAVRLIDTAGLRDAAAADPIEQAGMQRARQAAALADLRLHVVDAQLPRQEALPHGMESSGQSRGVDLLVLNKIDCGEHSSWAEADAVRLSCQSGLGVDTLAQLIPQKLLAHSPADPSGGLLAINARHQSVLTRSHERLASARTALLARQPMEFVALDLREAMEAIGEVAGRADVEEILGSIFGQFCIGK